ncbi:MAG: adenylate/guanylate cyclase domain-containing protein [Spirochaetota bacterium]
MSDVAEKLLGRKVNGVRVVPLMVKIIVIFTVFILISNLFSNYVNLTLNRGEQVQLMNQLLVKDVTDLYSYGRSQAELLEFTGDEAVAESNLESAATRRFRFDNSMAAGVEESGDYVFAAGVPEELKDTFPDSDALQRMSEARSEGTSDGTLEFTLDGSRYFGVYKWHDNWDAFFLRAEQQSEFYESSQQIFYQVATIILGITLLCVIVGIFVLRYILRFVPVITNGIMRMQDAQRIDLLDIKGAPNDDVTYLGIAFNSLAYTIDNLMNIFKKFVAREVAQKAYREREIRLEGQKRDLTILFTDIRSFTFMTETLGTDIIKLLNLHYDRAIHHIHEYNGDIGSIIGDALLAVFGTVQEDEQNKSYLALRASASIQEVAASLRKQMSDRRDEILRTRGELTDAEERIYQAVLLQVGVGLDGGEVFYGNIGSTERMVNTVIGDNVNSASRLEGLTRLYGIPIVASEYIKDEVERDFADYYFLELDTVQVKGKTTGMPVYWPIERSKIDDDFERHLNRYANGLHFYYEGDWPKAYKEFSECPLPPAEVFADRTGNHTAPEDWNGIWAMTEK